MEPSSEANDPGTTPPQKEQRQRNPRLRGLVDGLLDHIRDLSSRVDELSPEELEYEHQRFNMIAELMWAAITDEKRRPVVRSEMKRE
jgi:hypothetical protein